MQQKLCLWMCAAVLLGALCIGNPFLPCRSASLDAAPGAPSAAPAPMAVEAAPAPAGNIFALDARVPSAGAAPGRTAAGHRGTAAPATPASLRTSLAVDASSMACPDASLQPLVVAVERTVDGEPIWVLRDGRRLVRNPDPHGKLLLIPADAYDR